MWVQVQQRNRRYDLRAEADTAETQRIEHGFISYAAFVDPTTAFDTVSHDGLWKILVRLGRPPKSLTILQQHHEGQQGQVKHNGSLSGSFPVSNGVKQECVLAPTFFSIFFSILLCDAKEDLPDGIYIRFRTEGSLFNLRRLLARTKSIEEFITELLFAKDYALLAHTEETLQHIVNRFSDAAKNFVLTISLKKTMVLYQSPPREPYNPPHISIDGINLNAVEHFTYLGSVISSDATVGKDLVNRSSKASSSFWKAVKESMAESRVSPLHKNPGIQSKTTCRTKKCSKEPACPA